MTPEVLLVHLQIAGVLMALLVAVNVYVPCHLRWREELPRLSLINRQVFVVHSMFIVLILAMSAALLLTSSDSLLEPGRLSRAILAGLTVFWTTRMVMQWGYYSPQVWRGNPFNTLVHYLFSAVWVYLSVTFGAALWLNLSMR
jgi:hypothetical protein